MSRPEDGLSVPVQNVPAAQALEVIKELIKDDDGRQDYRSDPQGAFDRKRATLPEQSLRDASYGAIPTNSRLALEGLTEEQLELLSNLDQTFVEDGLYVQVPSPGKLFFK
jgi:hypothetical protein